MTETATDWWDEYDANPAPPRVTVDILPNIGRPTDKQLSFLAKLAAERGVPVPDVRSKSEASAAIDELLATPRPARTESTPSTRTTAPTVGDGRYAIDTADGLRFYRVNTPTEGRWQGYTFVDAVASDDCYPVKNRERRAAILDAIAVDPMAALLRYGREIGACGHCGRTLTDATSRAAGIGPVCAAKYA